VKNILSLLPPLILLGAYVAFWAWEGISAAGPQSLGWRRRGRNLALSAFGLTIGGLSGGGLLALSATAEARNWALAAFAHAHPATVTVAGVLVLDFADYWRHRISHSVPLLWRVHRVHHSDARMDVTTSLRSHPLEFALRPFFLGTAIGVFGVPTLSVLLFPVLQLPVLVFQHANVRLPRQLERGLAWLIVTPGMHAVHHSRQVQETNSNYATFLSGWDRVFNSLRPSEPPAAIGLDGFDGEDAQSFLGMLREPWRHRPQQQPARQHAVP